MAVRFVIEKAIGSDCICEVVHLSEGSSSRIQNTARFVAALSGWQSDAREHSGRYA